MARHRAGLDGRRRRPRSRRTPSATSPTRTSTTASGPAGLVDLSTTVGSTPQYLQDFGLTVVARAPRTHHLTLYRAASGALVFGAGTIQWGWGLDQDHDGDNSNPRRRRACSRRPSTCSPTWRALPTHADGRPGRSRPRPTDTQAPTVTVTAPGRRATIANGTPVTVTGTATDAGGGLVAGVEVSARRRRHLAPGHRHHVVDLHRHRCTATAPAAIQVRATDDSANTSRAAAVSRHDGLPVLAVRRTPCRRRRTAATPRRSSSGCAFTRAARTATSPASASTRRRPTPAPTPGRCGRPPARLLATGTFTGETASGWQTLQFASPVAVTADTTYVASYFAPNGHYSADAELLLLHGLPPPPLRGRADLAGRQHGQRRLLRRPRLPDQHLPRRQLLRRRAVRRPARPVPPSVTAQTPAPGRLQRGPDGHPDGDLLQADEPGDDRLHADRPVQQRRCRPRSPTTRPAKTATLTPSAALADGHALHGDGHRLGHQRQRAGRRRSPGTSAPPTPARSAVPARARSSPTPPCRPRSP